MATDSQENTPQEQMNYLEVLIEGIDAGLIKSRPDGSVHTIKAADAKTTVAEICVGKRDTRLNFKSVVADEMIADGLALVGQSKSWAGGGCKVTSENVGAAHETLVAVVNSIQPSAEEEPAVEDATAAQAEAEAESQGAQKRTQRRSRPRAKA